MKEEAPKRESKKEKVEWDRKKIIFTSIIIIFLLFLGYQAKSLFLDKNMQVPQNDSFQKEDVKGVSVSNPGPSIKDTVQESINSIKNEAGSINISDIATSSPQIQKVINDIKALQNYPSNELKNTCLKICNGL